jgi:hypothetical protein
MMADHAASGNKSKIPRSFWNQHFGLASLGLIQKDQPNGYNCQHPAKENHSLHFVLRLLYCHHWRDTDNPFSTDKHKNKITDFPFLSTVFYNFLARQFIFLIRNPILYRQIKRKNLFSI